jgi:hypothetical protein
MSDSNSVVPSAFRSICSALGLWFTVLVTAWTLLQISDASGASFGFLSDIRAHGWWGFIALASTVTLLVVAAQAMSLRKDGASSVQSNWVSWPRKSGLKFVTLKLEAGDYHHLAPSSYPTISPVKVTAREIVRHRFSSRDSLGRNELPAVRIEVDLGGRIAHGSGVEKVGTNEFLIPEVSVAGLELCSVFDFSFDDRSFRFFGIYVTHIDEVGKTVELGVCLAGR